jgi:hypothetical protein
MMSWGAQATEMLVALPVAIGVWIGAAWLWRRFGESEAKPRDSDTGFG